ncbi:MAG: chromosome segregation protein SMC [Luminiphilus sp.]
MRLKSIKLAGFKSFVDPTTVNFPSNMSAVVGPNGCGKSNIIDAVRWVMGESSAKNLRGEAMTDVIFNGTTQRQPVGQASIELLFDNSEGKIVGEYAAFNEISVRRVVGREGTSDYWLNGTKCRRRDITDLFLGTGLGPRSYAIIEQGMISRLIESKPEELRVFIEEAAGISKYKERRKETESRMRRTVENLERLTDLREELDRNLQHLQRQAQAAEKYAEYKSEERVLKAELLALQWRELQQESEGSRQAQQELDLKREAQRTELQHIESSIETLRVQAAEATDRFNEVQAGYYTVGGEVTRVEQAIKFEREKRETIQQDLESTQRSLLEAKGHLAADEERLTGWREELSSLEPALEQSRSASERAVAEMNKAEESMNDWQGQWDTFNQQASATSQKAEVEQSRIMHLEQVLRRLQERLSKYRAESESLHSQQDLTALDTLESELRAADSKVLTEEAGLQKLDAALDHHRQEIERLRGEQDEQRSTLQQLKGRHASLTALQQASANEEQTAVGDWLEQRTSSAGCMVLDQLEVDDDWRLAVEHVLGQGLSARCVTELGALASASLAEAPAGTYLVDGEQVAAGLSGTLAAKVAGPRGLLSLMQSVKIVSSVEEALRLLPSLSEGQSVITPRGEWLGDGWARTASSADPSAGLLERRELLAELDQEMTSATHLLGEIEKQLEESRQRRAETEHARGESQERLKAAVKAQAEKRAEHATELAAVDQVKQRQEQLRQDVADASSQFDAEQKALGESRHTLQAALDQMERDGVEREQLASRRDELRQALGVAREEAREKRDDAHSQDIRCQNLTTQISAVQDTIERLNQQVRQLDHRAETLTAQMPADQEPDTGLKEELEALLAQRVVAEEALTAARQEVADREHALREQEKARVSAEHAVQAVQSELEGQRLQQAERQVRLENLEAQLKELEAIAHEVVTQLPDEASEPEWQVKVERVVSRIARLGAINLAAIDECAQASERKTYLDTQNDDLESALTTLQNAIRKIDKETRSRFQETFDQVNAGFADLFPKVFGGGTASLELTGDDLLDTGVAIMARPPGKKNSTIHLLSGGEKAMTAIALVFSIFQLNPAPFCMLDEVDAPLDDANVGRYARMVREMAERVQFIFITHNKITMEVADNLMGVTMHEPGVSRLVTVDVEEAAQLAAS